jgi:hypothetical protein
MFLDSRLVLLSVRNLKKDGVAVSSSGIMLLPSFLKIGQAVQMLKRDKETGTSRGNLINLLSFPKTEK